MEEALGIGDGGGGARVARLLRLRCGLRGLRRLERVGAGGVAFELQAGEELAGGGIRVSGGDAAFAYVGQRGCVGDLLLVGEREVVDECSFGGAVLFGVGLDREDEGGDVLRVDGVV